MTKDDQAPKLHIDADWKAQAQAEKEALAREEKQAARKVHVDQDWKAQAQAEKERLAEADEERQKQRGDAPGGHGRPEADFRSLVGVLASQAIMGLGAIADPQSGRAVIDLEGAQFSIDLLGVLEEKTKGQLTDDEAKELRHVLAELRSRFVQVTQLIARQAAATPGEGRSPAGDAPDPATPG